MNVRIVLLPDGEDPDSYSRKVSSTQFAEYLKSNETDFIKFKTRLLLAEANNDPVQRAGLIRDIVRSIAVIPETITRTVYIKECSVLLEVAEPIIINEVNKLRQQKSFQERNRYPGPQDVQIPVPRAEVPKQVVARPATGYSEREIVRLLLKFGSSVFEKITVKGDEEHEEVITVADFIVREITSDDLGFDDSVCSKIFSEFRFNAGQGLMTTDMQFVKHEDPEISKLSADLLADTHELSQIWTEKQSYVETEEMKLQEIVGDTVLKFKSDKISKMRKGMMVMLEEAVKAGDGERIGSLQRRITGLNMALGMISKQLGNRIVL
jgi:DNA primase